VDHTLFMESVHALLARVDNLRVAGANERDKTDDKLRELAGQVSSIDCEDAVVAAGALPF
jgi:hypothetical protein